MSRKAAKLPPIPATVRTTLGVVTVEWKDNLKARDGDAALGLWLPEFRTIQLCTGIHLTTAWATLIHEITHAILWDSGSDVPSKIEERVCDALGTFCVHELLAGRAPFTSPE